MPLDQTVVVISTDAIKDDNDWRQMHRHVTRVIISVTDRPTDARTRAADAALSLSLSLSLCVCVCVCVCILYPIP